MLGEVLQRTERINPLQAPEVEFDYIDVSSISNATYQIEETHRLKGKDAPSRAQRLVKANDVLFATVRPTLQRIAVVPERLNNQVCSTGYFVLRPKAGVDHRFVFYSLFTEQFMGQMESLQKGASYPAVTDGEVRAQLISIPPLPEQQRIVGILDEAFDGIATAKANAKKNLENARALFESHLQSVFTQRGEGLKTNRLSEIYSFKNGINFDRTQKIDRGILTIDVLNMYGDDLEVKMDSLYRVNKEVSGEYILKDGDILVVRSSVKREGVGWAALFRETIEPTTFCGFIIRGRPIVEIQPQYVVYFLRSRLARDELIRRATQSTITNINQLNLGELIVPMFSLSEQQRIVTKLDNLREETKRLESIYQQKLAALDELKRSLLNQAFTGEL
jgi:type I restriction enzyme, S subunit